MGALYELPISPFKNLIIQLLSFLCHKAEETRQQELKGVAANAVPARYKNREI